MTPISGVMAYRINDAAKAMGISRTRLYELVSEGNLRKHRIAGRSVILREDLESFVRGCVGGD